MTFTNHQSKVVRHRCANDIKGVVRQPPATGDLGIIVLPDKQPLVQFLELDAVLEFDTSFGHFGNIHSKDVN